MNLADKLRYFGIFWEGTSLYLYRLPDNYIFVRDPWENYFEPPSPYKILGSTHRGTNFRSQNSTIQQAQQTTRPQERLRWYQNFAEATSALWGQPTYNSSYTVVMSSPHNQSTWGSTHSLICQHHCDSPTTREQTQPTQGTSLEHPSHMTQKTVPLGLAFSIMPQC